MPMKETFSPIESDAASNHTGERVPDTARHAARAAAIETGAAPLNVISGQASSRAALETQWLDEAATFERMRDLRGGIVAATAAFSALALMLAAICGLAAWPAMEASAEEAPAQVSKTVALRPEPEHAHEWAALTETVHHDAVTRTVEHPAEYAQQTAYHTICNECGEILDKAAEQHMEATGHSGYTVNVPREETVLAKGAWSEVVVVEDAYDEVKVNGSICLGCGEVQRAAAAAE